MKFAKPIEFYGSLHHGLKKWIFAGFDRLGAGLLLDSSRKKRSSPSELEATLFFFSVKFASHQTALWICPWKKQEKIGSARTWHDYQLEGRQISERKILSTVSCTCRHRGTDGRGFLSRDQQQKKQRERDDAVWRLYKERTDCQRWRAISFKLFFKTKPAFSITTFHSNVFLLYVVFTWLVKAVVL